VLREYIKDIKAENKRLQIKLDKQRKKTNESIAELYHVREELKKLRKDVLDKEKSKSIQCKVCGVFWCVEDHSA